MAEPGPVLGSERAGSSSVDSAIRYSPPQVSSSRSWELSHGTHRVTTLAAAWPTHPVPADCPRCRWRGVTRVSRETGLGTWAAVGGLVMAGCLLGCCLLPFAWDCCKDVTHSCPECGCELGKRACAAVVRGRAPTHLHHHHHHHHQHQHLNLGDLAAAVAAPDGGGDGGGAEGWGLCTTTAGIGSLLMHRRAS